MTNKNGMAKNMERVSDELAAWGVEMKDTAARLKTASFRFDNTNIFHILTAFLEETIDQLPRTLTYLIILYGVVRSIVKIVAIL